MKKLFCFLTVLVLILSAGCAKEDGSLTEMGSITDESIEQVLSDEKENLDVPDAEESDDSGILDIPGSEEPKDENAEKTENQETVNKNDDQHTTSQENEPLNSEKTETPESCEQILGEIFPELAVFLKEREYIVIQAKKFGESTVVADEHIPSPYEGTTRMQLEVTNVFHGPLKAGDKINYWEILGEYWISSDVRQDFHLEGIEAIRDETEYLMLLEKDQLYSDVFYRILKTEYGSYSYFPINEREAIAQRVKDGTATKYDQFHHAFFEGLVE